MTTTTLWSMAERLVNEIDERQVGDNPFIVWCHESTTLGKNVKDEIAWCSSFVNRLAWCLRFARSKSAAARSWLMVGRPVTEADAQACANDVVILQRGSGPQPGPEVTDAPGHVGIYGGIVTHPDGRRFVRVCGGNQKNNVTIEEFPAERILGIRRIAI